MKHILHFLFMGMFFWIKVSVAESHWITENGYGAYCIGELNDAMYNPATCILVSPKPDEYYRWDPINQVWMENIDAKKTYIRMLRDQELEITDKYMLSDKYLGLSREAQAVIFAYRQALRDAPNHDDINEVAMPTPIEDSVFISNNTKALTILQASVQTMTMRLTSAQIKKLRSMPITLVPAQGSDTVINVLSCVIKMEYGENSSFKAGAKQTLRLAYNDVNGSIIIKTAFSSAGLSASFNQIARTIPADETGEPYINVVNAPVVLFNSSATEIKNNDDNDNEITVILTYQVLDI